MAKRDNHYEAAFEAFLRQRGVPYVAVDEAKRSLLAGEEKTLKSLDFIVTPPAVPTAWLVDVKGRRFPAGTQKQYWKNWTTGDELRSLARWEELLGGRRFTALFVFAYHIVGDFAPVPAAQLFSYRERWYGFLGIRLHHYTARAHLISPKWDTHALTAAQFREMAEPLDGLLFPRAVVQGRGSG
jgi:hypothetical protein